MANILNITPELTSAIPMKKLNSQEAKLLLIKAGIKEALIANMNDEQIILSNDYLTLHKNDAKVIAKLSSIIAMEIKYKKTGALFLAAHSIASFNQLKHLDQRTINDIIELFTLYQDPELAQAEVIDKIVILQQRKMYNSSEGLNGSIEKIE